MTQIEENPNDAIAECAEGVEERAEKSLRDRTRASGEPPRAMQRLVAVCQWLLLFKTLRLMGASVFPESLAKPFDMLLSYLAVLVLAAALISCTRLWNALKARLAKRKRAPIAHADEQPSDSD